MKTLGFVNPKARAGQSRLIFNLGWVLANAGLRVGLVDFDPQTRLTELAGKQGDARGSIHDVLAPLLDAAGELRALDLVELGPNLWLARGHILLSTFDDALASAWSPSADPQALNLRQGIGHVLEATAQHGELDVVLCDLGSTLGPLCHAIAAAIDAIIVPVAPRAIEGASLRSLASLLLRWREEPSCDDRPDRYQTLGFVIVRPSGAVEIGTEQLVAAYERELSGEHLGTIKEFPSLAAIARAAHKPEIELNAADGIMGSQLAAVNDLRQQYEALATTVANVGGLLDEDLLVERIEHVLFSELETLPDALDSLSSRTIVDNVSDVEIEAMEIRPGGLRIVGSASLTVTLEWGGGESRDGVEVKDYFPLRFDLELDRSHESAMVVHRVDVDTSSFYE